MCSSGDCKQHFGSHSNRWTSFVRSTSIRGVYNRWESWSEKGVKIPEFGIPISGQMPFSQKIHTVSCLFEQFLEMLRFDQRTKVDEFPGIRM